jgi:hypothetical protein
VSVGVTDVMRMIGVPELIFVAAVIIVPFWKVFSKAGFPRYLS